MKLLKTEDAPFSNETKIEVYENTIGRIRDRGSQTFLCKELPLVFSSPPSMLDAMLYFPDLLGLKKTSKHICMSIGIVMQPVWFDLFRGSEEMQNNEKRILFLKEAIEILKSK